MLKVKSTAELAEDGPTKVLMYAHHGFGKTYQCRNYQKRYGKGLIISGEAGLKSIEDVDIDYIPFTSWEGAVDEEEGIYPFREIVKGISRPGFLDAHGYNWIAIDSLTEVSERLLEYLEEKHKGNANGFQLWGDYSRMMTGALKWVRDLPVHVYVTCLAKEEKDVNDKTHYWPHVKGQAVAKHIPALFDHVFCGVRMTESDGKSTPKVKRYIVTEEVSGWHGKARDPRNRLRAYEPGDDVTRLLDRMAMDDDEWAKLTKTTPKGEDE